MNLIISLFLLLSTSSSIITEDTNYFKSERLLKFAEHLYEEEDYLRAAGEFKRYLFSCDSASKNRDEILYRIGISYRKAGKFDEALEYHKQVISEYPESPITSSACYQISLTEHLMENFEESNQNVSYCLNKVFDRKTEMKLKQIRSLNYLMAGNWNKAYKYLKKSEPISKDTLTRNLEKFAVEGLNLSRKNPAIAGILSSVIPGSGKLYCGRPADGFFSLLTIGLTGWQAYEGFKKDGQNSIKGWALGTLGGILYLGNIYGSVVAADIYNREKKDELLTEIKLRVKIYLE